MADKQIIKDLKTKTGSVNRSVRATLLHSRTRPLLSCVTNIHPHFVTAPAMRAHGIVPTGA